MRILLAAALALAAAVSPAPVYERELAGGMLYRVDISPTLPRVIHAIRVDPSSTRYRLVAEVGNGVVFNLEQDKGRETVSQAVARTEALAGINADFFPFNGDPLNLMVRNGELLSRADPRRAVFALGDGYAKASLATTKLTLTSPALDAPVDVFGLNEECGDNMLVLNTSSAAYAMSREPALHLVMTASQTLQPNKVWKGTVDYLAIDDPSRPEGTSLLVPPGKAVLTARGAPAAILQRLPRDANVEIKVELTGVDTDRARQVVAGGPFLVKDGKVDVDWRQAGMKEDFSTRRHPRTAIGRTADGHVWLMVVDGRQPMSVGATLPELGILMQRLGCIEAINLDGGGSSTLAALGLVLNRPSDGQERKVANMLLVEGRPEPATETRIIMKGRPRLVEGESALYSVEGGDGRKIPAYQVLWSCMGDAWVDPTGTVRALALPAPKAGETPAPGRAVLSAYARGRTISVEIEIARAPKKPTVPGA